MSKFSVKTLLIIFVSLLITIVVLWKFVLPKQKIKATWWNDSWHYRKIINVVNNTNFDATNIPYKINLDTASLISGGKLQADADDIRIIDQNGNLIRSQIEKKTLNTSSSVIWFEVTVKSKNSSSYYVYYGNSTATAPVFESDINTFTSNSTSTTIEMKDGFGYTTSSSNGGRISDIRKNSANLGVDGNVPYSSSYPGNWWSGTGSIQTIQNSTGPLFAEVTYGAGTTGSYSSYGTNIKIFDNGFAETQFFVTYNTSGSENFYYYLSFDSGTRNSVWVDGSGNLVDQSTNSGNLYETNLGQNWFGQRWTSTGNYGGTIITKNGSDWQNGGTSAQASYFQTNYSYSRSFTNGSSREVRFGVFAGDGGLSEMQQKGANYGALSLSSLAEESGGGPVAYWKFDEGVGTTVFDSSSNQNNGILTGTTLPTWTQGKNNTGISFSGVNDSLSIPYKPDFRNALTVSIWIKRTTDFNQTADVMLLSPANAWYFYDSYNSGNIHGDVFIDTVRKGAIDVPVPFDGNWYYIVYTYDSNTHMAKMYKNGILYRSVLLTGLSNYLIDSATGNLYNMGLQSKGRGMILDEPKIYNYARTADQIKQDYNSRGSLSGSSVNLGIKSNTTPSLKSSLIGYFKLNEGNGTNIYDSSGNNNNGNIVGAGWSSAKYSIGLSLNGTSNYVNLGTNIGATNFTVSTWFKQSNTISDTYYGCLISRSDGYGYHDNYNLYVDKTNNKLNCRIGFGGSIGKTVLGITNVYDNNWHQAICTANYDGVNTIMTLYLDGKIENQTSQTGAPYTSSSLTTYLGKYSSQFFPGLIDEVKIYNRALTDEEIKQDYNSGSAISFGSTTQNIGGTTTSLEYCIPGDTSYCASPVAEWNFEENTGTVAKDTSGNNLNGTFGTGNSAPSWSLGANNKGASTNFDGNDFINIGDTLSGNNLSNLFSATYSFWIYPKSLTSNASSGQRLIEKRDSSIGSEITTSGYIYTGFWYSTGYDFWSSAKKLGYYDSGIDEWTTSNLNKWYYISIVFDSPNNTGKTYINGILDKEYTLVNNNGGATGVNNSTLATQLGRYRWNENNFFQGKMDNVRIYNYARTPAQIAYDYNKGAPIGWWKLDECQGNIAHDSSPIGNNGSINIGTSGIQTSAGTCNTSGTAWGNGTSGHINSSLNFDGMDDVVDIGSTYSKTAFTLSSWVKRSGPINGAWGSIIGLRYATEMLRGVFVNQSNIIQYHDFLGTPSDLSSGVNTVIGQWYHVVLSYDGSMLKLYVNSVLKNSYNNPIFSTYNPSGIQIGGTVWNTGNQNRVINGQIDDVRIYNYALTPEQIKQVYNNGAINFN